MLDRLMTRFDPDLLGRRLRLQVEYIGRLFGDGVGGLHLENIDAIFPVARAVLKLSGLWGRGMRNMTELCRTHHIFGLRRLPPAFDGLRVLHLSDLHIDCSTPGHPRLAEVFAEAVAGLDFDLCVITGDFRYHTSGPYERVYDEVLGLVEALACEHGIYGVLGNHDFIEQVPYLEDAGIKMLVNESASIEVNGEALWLVGLDDPHFYGTHDWDAALAEVPADACKLLLVHSPEIAEEARRRGVSLYLAGHTHGGQICLPGGFAPYINARCPRQRTLGRWRCGPMHGYTSAGTGSSGMPVRFNQPPEVALLELRRAAIGPA